MQVTAVRNGRISFKSGVLKVSDQILVGATRNQLRNLQFMRDALNAKSLLKEGDQVLYMPAKKGATQVILKKADEGKLFGNKFYGMLDDNYPDESAREFMELMYKKPLKGTKELYTKIMILFTKFTQI